MRFRFAAAVPAPLPIEQGQAVPGPAGDLFDHTPP